MLTRVKPREAFQISHRGTATLTRISRRETFQAAHQLSSPDLTVEENQRVFGKCTNIHGHNYAVEVVLCGTTDPSSGYLHDLKQLSDVIRTEIVDQVDHRNLNTDVEWLAGRNPTAEVLAAAFWDRLEAAVPEGWLERVRVRETENNWAECCRDERH